MTAEPLTQIGTNPFPGLRPFEFDESHLFFGRDGQCEQVLRKLSITRFVAVVGTSGSGKSSLARAGLLPELYGGMMPSAGANWRIALMRPGNNPIGELASKLNEPAVFGSEENENAREQISITEAMLRRGSLGLIDAVRQAMMPSDENLLVLVDQFEEIFRFAKTSESETFKNEAAAFVKLLLEASRQREVNIYILLTMRSDFLGHCAMFRDLPEAINDGQYLVPRLTRDQLREAITGPIAVAGAAITPRLVDRLLNDIGDDQDQLPVLQHALMRMWDEWERESGGTREGETGEPEGVAGDDTQRVGNLLSPHPSTPLDLRHYDAIGGMAEALSRHADEAYYDLPDDHHRLIAEKIFKSLTEIGEDNLEIRRPVTISELCAVADATEAEARTVINVFRQERRSFLLPPAQVQLQTNSLIDISHESLIRVWRRLNDWVEEETRSARTYERLAETAKLHQQGEASLWRDPDLQLALRWRNQHKPNQPWAKRYDPEFDLAMRFLDTSQQAHEKERIEKEAQQKQKTRRAHRLAIVFAIAFLIAGVVAWIAGQQWLRAEKGEENYRRMLYVANVELASRAVENGIYARASDLLNTYLSDLDSTNQNDLRDFTWRCLWWLSHNEKQTLIGHENGVISVAFIGDGKTLASSGWDGKIKLWDVQSGKELATFSGHTNEVRSVAISRDGKTLASGSSDHTVKLWDIQSRKELATFSGHTNIVESVVFNAENKIIASSSWDHTIRLWDVQSGKELATLSGHTGPVYSVTFSGDGKLLASGSGDRTIKLWDVQSGKELTTFKIEHQDTVFSVAFSADGKMLASGSGDSTVKLWDVRDKRVKANLIGHHNSVASVIFSRDGKTLASSSWDGTIKLWDTQNGQALATFSGHSAEVRSVAISEDGKTMASGSLDRTIKLWDIQREKDLTTFRGHANEVRAVAISGDGKTVASGGVDRTIKLWDVQSGNELKTSQGHNDTVSSVTFSADGKTLASSSWDRTIKLWDVQNGRELATLQGHTNFVSSVSLSQDGKILASGSGDNTIKLWDVQRGNELATLRGHTSSVNSVNFSRDGKMLASGGSDSRIRLWDVQSGKELRRLSGHTNAVYSVVFSRDGKTLASSSDDSTIRLWDVQRGSELAILRGHTNAVYTVSFSEDGKTLASGSRDMTVKLWDIWSGKELVTLRGQTDTVSSVAFSQDNRILISGSHDRTVKLYYAATDEAISHQRVR
ncbi:MAG: hypothetical protein JST84_15890 [Acidobacteria bacterium]|nr:hypothetical protein [Acidobacteriota bacterium]